MVRIYKCQINNHKSMMVCKPPVWWSRSLNLNIFPDYGVSQIYDPSENCENRLIFRRSSSAFTRILSTSPGCCSPDSWTWLHHPPGFSVLEWCLPLGCFSSDSWTPKSDKKQRIGMASWDFSRIHSKLNQLLPTLTEAEIHNRTRSTYSDNTPLSLNIGTNIKTST